MIDENLPRKKRCILLSEVFQTETKLDGLSLHEISGEVKSIDEQHAGVVPDFENHLQECK